MPRLIRWVHGSFCGLCLAQAQIFDLVHVYVSFQLLMEFTGGQNLNIYLTRKTLSLDVLRCYTIEIVEALEYLHNKAVVHKNLRVSQSYISYVTRHSQILHYRDPGGPRISSQ